MENRKNELISFWRKLGKLIESGVPLLHTLQTIVKETQDGEFKTVVEGIARSIETGKSLRKAIAKSPEWFSASVQDVINVGEIQGTLDKAVAKVVEGLTDGTFEIKEKPQVQSLDNLLEKDADAEGVVKAVNIMLYKSIENRASDIHLETLADRLRVRYRTDGVLHEMEPLSKEIHEAVINRIKIMANMNIAEKRLPQDGRFVIKIKNNDVDFRVSTVPYATGESAVLRVLSRQAVVLELDRIGFTQSNLEKLRHWIKRPNGLIIATGPTGSGKTTLLYCILQALNSPEVKITTIEDPVEYIIEGINQQPVRLDAGVTFARALRCQLRQAPNIIMVGETRDLESVQIEIQAALTGHLVLTTLHTNGAPETIQRLLDIGAEPFLINNTLIGAVAQRLVRVICQNCKEEYKPEPWIMELLGPDESKQFLRGKGCEKCHKTGFRGRIAIHEMLELDDALRKLIAKDAGAAELRKQAIESGMITMRQDGIEKARQGITTIEEVLRTCTTPV